jgi:hypothetical protein
MIADRFRDDGERGNAMGIVSIALGLGPIGKSKNENSFFKRFLNAIFNSGLGPNYENINLIINSIKSILVRFFDLYICFCYLFIYQKTPHIVPRTDRTFFFWALRPC